MSNVLITFSPPGDAATCVSYFTVHQELEGSPLQPICAGRYYDTFEKHKGEGRFTSHKVVPRLMGDLHLHVGKPDAFICRHNLPQAGAFATLWRQAKTPVSRGTVTGTVC